MTREKLIEGVKKHSEWQAGVMRDLQLRLEKNTRPEERDLVWIAGIYR